MIIGTPAPPPRSLISLSCHLRFLVPRSPSPCPLSPLPLPPPPPPASALRPVLTSCPLAVTRESPSALIRLLRSTLTPCPLAFPHQDTCILISYLAIRIRDSNTKPHVPPVTNTSSTATSTARRSSRGPASGMFPLYSLTLLRPLFLSRGLYNYSISVINLFIHLFMHIYEIYYTVTFYVSK